MKILLLGEYSNVHNTLSKGLRELGHEVTVASNGDFWKDYPRDIDLSHTLTIRGRLSFLWRLLKALPQMKGYDIVQLINPLFMELRAERIIRIYKYLRRHNRKVVLGAFGMDYYWMHINDTIKPLRYSDSNIGDRLRLDTITEAHRKDWIGTAKQQLNEYIAKDCDRIVSGLYEYWATYNAVPELKGKNTFIPYPIEQNDESQTHQTYSGGKIKIFIGVSVGRSEYKGTDIMLQAARDIEGKYPDKVDLRIAQGVPFVRYRQMMDSSDIILDQLYAYTPAMNALLAMSKGIIVVGGGEPENYDILGEKELRPIINVLPTYESCYHELEQLVLHPERIPELQRQSIEYIHRHHDYIKVARRYINLYEGLLSDGM